MYETSNRRFHWTFAYQVKRGLGKHLLNLPECADHHIQAVIRMESSGTNQAWTKRLTLSKAKSRHVHNIRNNLGLQTKLAKNVNEISRWNHQLVCVLKHRPNAAKSLQMIPGFAAVIVNHRFRSMQPGDEPRRKRRDQKRPIGCRKDMRYLDVLQTTPQRSQ